jgi:hypothetical protein
MKIEPNANVTFTDQIIFFPKKKKQQEKLSTKLIHKNKKYKNQGG